MTEAEWLECIDPQKMFAFVQGKVSDRKLRLFAVACCRRIWHLFTDVRSKAAIELIEQYDGQINRELLDATQAEEAADEANTVLLECPQNNIPPEVMLAEATAYAAWWAVHPPYYADQTAEVAAFAVRISTGVDSESRLQTALFREILGNPFRPVTAEPTWLTPTVVSLATAIYDERAFDRLPILADALEDAGCTNANILDHCRQPGEHVRGCWAVDLVLGKS